MAINKYKLITFTVLFTVTTFGLTNAQFLYQDDICRTPNGDEGNCVIINECKSILDYLDRHTKITEETVGTLRRYYCGFQGKSVKMCCSDKPIIGTTTPVPTPLPPNVDNHRNIHLLPPASDCGFVGPDNRIINGNKTSLYEFPWMTLLSYQTRTGTDFRCGGTLINDRYVLTAAHCITNLNNLKLLGVRLGEHNIALAEDCELDTKTTTDCAEPVQDILLEEVIPHPNYNSTTYSNDIGLLRLSSPAELKKRVQPICLPISETLRNKNFTNGKGIVAGWGSTGKKSRRSDILLKVEISIIAESDCKVAYNQTKAVINYKQFCAGGKMKKDSCGGDSGGPLQRIENIDIDDARMFQLGIVSFGPSNCGQDRYPGVYTRIDYYMDWILDNIHE